MLLYPYQNFISLSKRTSKMKPWIEITDEIGPEKILHVHDPAIGMKGVVVIDSTPNTFIATGGIRMLPDITTEEVAGLARAMTYKNTTLEIPLGGAKSGIWADPSIKGEERKELMRSFGRAVKPLLEARIVGLGADIGTDGTDLEYIHEGAEVPMQGSGLHAKMMDGEPFENHSTGFGVVISTQAACEHAGINFKGASVAIEGFGKAGGGVARYINDLGAKVVALSTVHGAIYNKNGLDMKHLMEKRKDSGDKAVMEYKEADHLKKEELFNLPVDVLIPGARPYVISNKNAAQVGAKIISSIANIPITDDAEELLFQKGIHVVPDFISNAGGVVTAVIDALGGTTDQVFKAIENIIGALTTEILESSRKFNINPRRLAMQRVEEKIRKAQREKQVPSVEEVIEKLHRRMMM